MTVRSSSVSGPGLQQDGVRDADLADVVEDGAELERLQLRLREPDSAADLERERGEALASDPPCDVAGLDRVRERAGDGRREQAFAQLDLRQSRRLMAVSTLWRSSAALNGFVMNPAAPRSSAS